MFWFRTLHPWVPGLIPPNLSIRRHGGFFCVKLNLETFCTSIGRETDMAFLANKRSALNAVRLISRSDDAVDHDESDWDRYDEDPVNNHDAIVFKSGREPTFFLCNFNLNGKESARVKDAMVKGVDRDDQSVNLSYGKWAYTVAQLTLKDIQNPPNIDGVVEFKKSGTGYALDSVLSVLDGCGVLQEIFNHYINLTQSETTANAKN